MSEYLSTRFLDHLLPFLMLALLLGAVVVALNILGKHLERHDDWLAALDARVDGLHKDRKATWARRLKRPYAGEPVPPPLPHHPTPDAIDWSDDDKQTELLAPTARYPDGKPPPDRKDDT